MKKELLNQQEDQDKKESTSLINYREVKGTPFVVVEGEKGIILVLGNHVVKSGFESTEQAIKYVKAKSWELILTAGAIYNQIINDQIKEK